jgi:hypothetical protein
MNVSVFSPFNKAVGIFIIPVGPIVEYFPYLKFTGAFGEFLIGAKGAGAVKTLVEYLPADLSYHPVVKAVMGFHGIVNKKDLVGFGIRNIEVRSHAIENAFENIGGYGRLVEFSQHIIDGGAEALKFVIGRIRFRIQPVAAGNLVNIPGEPFQGG